MAKTTKKTAGKKREKTPSFVVTLRLLTTPHDDRLFADRLNVAKRLTNPLVADVRYVLRVLKRSPEWKSAGRMPKATDEQKALRYAAFAAAKRQYGFERPAFEKRLDAHARAAGFSKRISSDERQKLAKRVFDAAEQYLFGKRGIPDFKGIFNPLDSVEGKSQTNMLKLSVDLAASSATLQVSKGWTVAVRLDAGMLKNDPWLAEALHAKVKYCRLVRKIVRGHVRWYVQATLEGVPPVRQALLDARKSAAETAGLDLGVSTLAVVASDGRACILNTASPKARQLELDADALRRKIDRQRRANNPQMYRPDFKDAKGRRKKGKALPRRTRPKTGWEKSKRMLKAESALREVQRLAAEERKNHARRTANAVVAMAKNVKDDGVSPKALQRRFGRAARSAVPGFLMSELIRKIVALGGSRAVIDVGRLKTSQYDHTTNDFRKKPLKQRIHEFRDGSGTIQRDIYSAVLALLEQDGSHRPQEISDFLQSIDTGHPRAGRSEFHEDSTGRSCRIDRPTEQNDAPSEDFARYEFPSGGLNRGSTRGSPSSTRNPPPSGGGGCQMQSDILNRLGFQSLLFSVSQEFLERFGR